MKTYFQDHYLLLPLQPPTLLILHQPISHSLPSSNPLSAFSVKTAINLTLGIVQKLRNKIYSREYDEFALLLKPVEIDSEVRNNYHT